MIYRDPVLHTFIEDMLPDDHPLARSTLHCNKCQNTILHAPNNECMTEWVETGAGNYCLNCFAALCETDTDGFSDRMGIPVK